MSNFILCASPRVGGRVQSFSDVDGFLFESGGYGKLQHNNWVILEMVKKKINRKSETKDDLK